MGKGIILFFRPLCKGILSFSSLPCLFANAPYLPFLPFRSYVTSNVMLRATEQPLGGAHYVITQTPSGLRALVLGFLYDFPMATDSIGAFGSLPLTPTARETLPSERAG